MAPSQWYMTMTSGLTERNSEKTSAMRGLKMRRHMSGETIMPFWAPKSSPVQMPSTPSSTSCLPMSMLQRMVRSMRASM